MGSGSYVLTELTKRNLESKGYEFVCFKCGKPIKAGEVVYSRVRSNRPCTRAFYHEECWKSLFM